MHPRRYYLLKSKSPEYDKYSVLPLVWRAKHGETAGTDLPVGFPGRDQLILAGYSTIEDVDGAEPAELMQYAGLSTSTAIAAVAAIP